MKKKLNVLQLISAVVGCVILAGLVTCGMTSCKNTTLPWGGEKTPAIEETVDSLVQLAVMDAINPSFESAEQVVVYRDLSIDGESIDSVFKSMSERDLFTVSSVVIKRLGSATKKDIVEEYNSHADIYNNLPQSEQPTQNVTLNEGDPGAKKDDVFSTSYRFHTDTVDGQPVKVQIKEEKSYVR